MVWLNTNKVLDSFNLNIPCARILHPHTENGTENGPDGSGPTEELQGIPPVARFPLFRPAVQCRGYGLRAVHGERCRSLGW